jgi:acetyl esterase/lipase
MDVMIPKRKTFTLPPELEPFAKVMEEAGIKIVYGPNSVPPPEGLSKEAKKAWANLPQVPLLADDLEKLTAVRKFTSLAEEIEFKRLKTKYSMEDRVINGITTLWITPQQLKHADKVMIFLHGGGGVVNSRKTQLSLQTAVADSLGVKVASIEYPLAPEHPFPDALNDVVAGYKGVIGEYGAENSGIFGTSGGGMLTLATLLRLKADGLPLPAASAPLSPGADMTASGYQYKAVGLQDPILILPCRPMWAMPIQETRSFLQSLATIPASPQCSCSLAAPKSSDPTQLGWQQALAARGLMLLCS